MNIRKRNHGGNANDNVDVIRVNNIVLDLEEDINLLKETKAAKRS